MSIIEHSIWSAKYRPKTIEECILPKAIKKSFQGFVDNKSTMHLFLSGDSGVGKSTVALALSHQLDSEVLFINSSLEGRQIDTIRNKVQQFASSYSFEGKKKVVIFDEFDNCTDTVQFSLKSFMEQYESNCTFIFTANFPNRVIDAIKSRCTTIEFIIPKNEVDTLTKQIFIKCTDILKENNVAYDKLVVGKIIKKYFPDFRKTINELQKLSSGGEIDVSALAVLESGGVDDLIEILKDKNFGKMRKWVASCPNLDMAALCRKLYDKADSFVVNTAIPDMVIHIADYSYKDSFVADKEIIVVAMLTQLMVSCDFKGN